MDDVKLRRLQEKLRGRAHDLPDPAERRRIRLAARATLQEVADVCGATHGAVRTWEAHSTPTGSRLVAYRETLLMMQGVVDDAAPAKPREPQRPVANRGAEWQAMRAWLRRDGHILWEAPTEVSRSEPLRFMERPVRDRVKERLIVWDADPAPTPTDEDRQRVEDARIDEEQQLARRVAAVAS